MRDERQVEKQKDRQAEKTDAEKKQRKKILAVKDLVRNYYTANPDGEKITYEVLKGISFSVYQGEFIGIMGSSGCGKTTLLKTLGMMNQPDDGEVLYKGVSTRKFYGDTLAKIRRTEISFIYQDFYLMDSLTVEENIMLPLILNEDNPKQSKKIARKMAEEFGIVKLLDKKPYELSGGERQRTAISRAMAANPELILADEPTGNLDSNSSRVVIQALSRINQQMGKTILLVTHDPKVASYCDKIILLKDGKIVDTLRKGVEQKAFYRKILVNMGRI